MTPEHFAIVFGLLYNLILLVGTAYVVFGLGFSGWWFLLALVLMVSIKTD